MQLSLMADAVPRRRNSTGSPRPLPWPLSLAVLELAAVHMPSARINCGLLRATVINAVIA